jgi:hypothetical protein
MVRIELKKSQKEKKYKLIILKDINMYLLRIFYDDFEHPPYEKCEEFESLKDAQNMKKRLDEAKGKYDYLDSEIFKAKKIE